MENDSRPPTHYAGLPPQTGHMTNFFLTGSRSDPVRRHPPLQSGFPGMNLVPFSSLFRSSLTWCGCRFGVEQVPPQPTQKVLVFVVVV